MTDTDTLAADLSTLFNEVRVLCINLDDDLVDDLDVIRDRFSDDEVRRILTSVLVLVRSAPEADEDDRAAIAGEVRDVVEQAIQRRTSVEPGDVLVDDEPDAEAGPARTVGDGAEEHLELFDHDGFKVRDVAPMPTFLGKTIHLREGFVNTRDIQFWEDNKRLNIDLENFRRRAGREPDPEELMKLLWPRGNRPKDDPYKIAALADDIAARGVLTPPVIDYWGTAWDGNRRLAACLYVLASPEYDDNQKERASKVRVWQTDVTATDNQIQAIITSLNFGDDFKVPWPEYVRARDVYDAYMELYDNEALRNNLTDRDVTRLRQRVAKRFGIKTSEVTRYCKMVNWANEFEDFHRENDRDENEIKTRTSELFQYFYELDAGRGEDKLATKFEADDGFRTIVFDLLFDGKIKGFPQVRELRRVHETPEAMETLREAHAAQDSRIGAQDVVTAIDLARQRSLAQRQAGRATDLERIAKWLNDDVTVAVLRKIDLNVLRDFRDAARAVDGMITALIGANVTSDSESS